MTDDRADGPTFALDNICFIDFETRSQTPIKSGTWRYATEADAIVLAYAIGNGPVKTIAVGNFSRPLEYWDLPAELREHYDSVTEGSSIFAAWNAGFDRAIWNYATVNFPEMLPHHIIDVMAQATASGLPADLNYASKFSGSVHKMAAGKSLIALFCLPDAVGTPQTHPDEWQAFLSYAGGDIMAMRDIFRRTRQLPLAEWQEYWAMEAINSRGIAIDLPMVEHAARLAAQDRTRSRQQLAEISNGAIRTVDQVKAMTEWLLDRLPPEGRDIILKREEEIDENQVITRPAKYSLTRRQVERLIAFNEDPVIDRILQLRLYGGSKTPAKFQRILDGHVDGMLYGQYVFNGAAQTGRASSKGVQCVTGDHEALTRYGWRRLDEIVGPCEIMAWSRDGTMQWETGEVHAFGVPDKIAHINGTMIRGAYTLDHRMPTRHTEGGKLVDYTPQQLLEVTRRGGFVIAGPVNQPDIPFDDVQLRLRVAMQADGHWAKRAAHWRFTKIRKIERMEMLLDEAGVPFCRKIQSDNATLFRIATADVPSWLIKDFGPWVLRLSSRQARLVLEEIREWDGYSHSQRGHLQIASPRKDQMEWVVTIAALAGYSATMNWYPSNKSPLGRWSVYIRSSVTTTLHHSEMEIATGTCPVFCPRVPSGYWLCRVADRVFVTGNTHNLARDTLAYEHDAIEALLAGTDYDAFAALGDSSPVARKLSLLIRPAFVPSVAANVFVWSDWSQIEARVLPWLCDHLAGSRSRINIFREVDCDPNLPDLYTRTAAQLSRVPITEVTKAMRQRGKVAELALGYCGGKGALQAMAAGYGMHFSDDEAQAIVDAWRAANPWAGIFARELWDAMLLARQEPELLFDAGRVGFCFLPKYLGGSLLCRLPSGRCLTWRALRREMVDEKDDDGKVVKSSLEWTYARGHSRQKLWPGILVENVTQAVAADILRGTLLRLEDQLMVRLHTHDEVLIEIEDDLAVLAAGKLRDTMQQGFAWSAGLPLMSEETISPYYSKRA